MKKSGREEIAFAVGGRDPIPNVITRMHAVPLLGVLTNIGRAATPDG